MEISLLLLSLGLILTRYSESKMKIIREEFSKEEMQYDVTKHDQKKQTLEGNSSGNDKENRNDMIFWTQDLEVNGSYEVRKNFVHGSLSVKCDNPKTPSCKCGQNPGISYADSLELRTNICQFIMNKQFTWSQHYRITSVKKILAVLLGHSLMSWLVSGSKL